MSTIPIITVVTPNASERQLEEAREPSWPIGPSPPDIPQRKPSDGSAKNPCIYAFEDNSICSTSSTISTSMHSALVTERDNVDNKLRRKEKAAAKTSKFRFQRAENMLQVTHRCLRSLLTSLFGRNANMVDTVKPSRAPIKWSEKNSLG